MRGPNHAGLRSRMSGGLVPALKKAPEHLRLGLKRGHTPVAERNAGLPGQLSPSPPHAQGLEPSCTHSLEAA